MKRIFTSFVSLFFILAAFAEDNNILIIHSYHQGLQWTDSISNGIMSVFKKHPEVDVYFDYIDTKRNTSEGYFQSLASLYRSRSSMIRYKAIITSDNAAYNFMLKYRDEFFPGVPVFFCGVNFLDKEELLRHQGFYGFEENADHTTTIRLIKKIFPERKKVLIINDQTLTGKAIRNELEQVLPAFGNELEFEFFDSFSIDELKEKVSSLSDDYTIYLLVVNMDRLGNFVSYTKGIKIVKENTQVPIFGSWDFYLDKGIIGGAITKGFAQGKNVAELAYGYLEDKEGSLKRWQHVSSTVCFDFNYLVKYDIAESLLPADAAIINRPAFDAEQVKWLRTTIIVMAFLLVVLLIYLYLRKVQARKLKGLVEQRTKELRTANLDLEKINQCKNEILSIVAHDLRNPIGNINGLADLIIENDEREKLLDDESRTNLHLIHELSDYMIRLVNNLLDISIIESGVLSLNCTPGDYVAYIADEVDKNSTLARKYNVDIEFKSKLDSVRVSFDEMKMQQAFNNLISNAVKFSKPGGLVIVTIEMNGKRVITKIKDSGPGIPSDKFGEIFLKYSQLDSDTNIKSKGTGLGLSIVKGIIEAHNGKIYLNSELGKGTEFIYELPIVES